MPKEATSDLSEDTLTDVRQGGARTWPWSPRSMLSLNGGPCLVALVCFRCARTPEQIPVYVECGGEQVSADDHVWHGEGTLNRRQAGSARRLLHRHRHARGPNGTGCSAVRKTIVRTFTDHRVEVTVNRQLVIIEARSMRTSEINEVHGSNCLTSWAGSSRKC